MFQNVLGRWPFKNQIKDRIVKAKSKGMSFFFRMYSNKLAGWIWQILLPSGSVSSFFFFFFPAVILIAFINWRIISWKVYLLNIQILLFPVRSDCWDPDSSTPEKLQAVDRFHSYGHHSQARLYEGRFQFAFYEGCLKLHVMRECIWIKQTNPKILFFELRRSKKFLPQFHDI